MAEIEKGFAEQLATQTGQADLARELTEVTERSLPEEKARLRRELDQTAKEVRGLESNYADGRGQAVASIPPIAYYRWNLEFPGCWKIKEFVDEFLQDNRECLLPGYKPKPKPVFFDMGRTKMRSALTGADIYWALKDKVNHG